MGGVLPPHMPTSLKHATNMEGILWQCLAPAQKKVHTQKSGLRKVFIDAQKGIHGDAQVLFLTLVTLFDTFAKITLSQNKKRKFCTLCLMTILRNIGP